MAHKASTPTLAWITFGMAFVCALFSVVILTAVQRAEKRLSTAEKLVDTLAGLESAVRNSDAQNFSVYASELSKTEQANPSYPEISDTLEVLYPLFPRIIRLENDIRLAATDSERVGRLRELQRLRSASDERVGEAVASLRRREQEIAAFLSSRWRYLMGLVGILAVLVVLTAAQLRTSRRSLLAHQSSEEALRKSEAKYRGLFENVLEGVYQTNEAGQILAANPALVRMFGFDSCEQLQQASRAGDLYLDPSIRERYVSRLIRTGELRNVELVLKRRDGSAITVLENSRVVKDSDGKVAYFEGTLVDITDRKLAEQEIAAAHEEAVRALRLKSEFLANVSHEIRTPMNGVIGMTSLLLDTDLTPSQREYAETVRRSAGYLLNIINDILDFSKIEAGRLEMEKIDFSLRLCVEDVLEMLAEQAESRNLELICSIDEDVPDTLRGDPGRLQQVITNLAGNALKFTKTGEVTVLVGVESRQESEITLSCAVQDTGIGITAEQMQRIFEPFCQGDGSTTRKYGGTGLGLNISKNIVELLGGRMRVESQPGAGSTFRFTAVFEIARNQPAPYGDELRHKRALIVDNNEACRAVLVKRLKAWGMITSTAATAGEALDIVSVPGKIDFLLIEYPVGGSGIHDLLRAAAAFGIPVVLLTPFGYRKSLPDALASDVFAILTKPLRVEALRRTLRDPAPLKRHVRNPAAAATVSAGNPCLPILIAEDNVVNQKVAVRLVEKLGFRAEIAANGLEAVEAVSRSRYGAILMDCQMPEMDGFAATAAIRQLEGTGPRMPIIAMTAHAMKGDRERCLEAGMDDYISKPVRFEELASIMNRWIEEETASAR